jgi:hypothetical protein
MSLPPAPPASFVISVANGITLSTQDATALPSFILPGDETAALMLPETPDILPLQQAFAAAAQRLTAQPPPMITFFDPVTGDDTDPDLLAAIQNALQQPWLLVDPALADTTGAASSRIRWDNDPI